MDKRVLMQNCIPFSYVLLFKKIPLFFIIILSCTICVDAQSLAVGTPALEDYYRRRQLTGELDSSLSFTLRPLLIHQLLQVDITDTVLSRLRGEIYTSPKSKTILGILPVLWTQEYRMNSSYSENDGVFIPALGYQTMLSAGVFLGFGPLSIQLKPDIVFAENKYQEVIRPYYGLADFPQRFGSKSYLNTSWGQSNIRLNFGPISAGISNENLWWGPGMRNSLLMSNNAPGFQHLTINTVNPIRTPIGSFEGQIIGGRLEGSGHDSSLPPDWRYLTAFTINYQPRWLPGFFLGLNRSFQTYHKNLKSFKDYFPLFRPFQKVQDDNQDENGDDGQDQLVSIHTRWLLEGARSEIYFEYGLNDHSYNTRDFIMAPDHSRAYLFGFRKLIPLKVLEDEFIQIGAEFTHLEQSIDYTIRNAGEWYTHSPIVHGYTNRGQGVGASIGHGGNLQSVNIGWVRGLNRLAFQIERFEHNGDLASLYRYAPWIDLSLGAIVDKTLDKFLISGKLQGIQSINYQWEDGISGRSKRNVFNVNAQLGIMYSFSAGANKRK